MRRVRSVAGVEFEQWEDIHGSTYVVTKNVVNRSSALFSHSVSVHCSRKSDLESVDNLCHPSSTMKGGHLSAVRLNFTTQNDDGVLHHLAVAVAWLLFLVTGDDDLVGVVDEVEERFG